MQEMLFGSNLPNEDLDSDDEDSDSVSMSDDEVADLQIRLPGAKPAEDQDMSMSPKFGSPRN